MSVAIEPAGFKTFPRVKNLPASAASRTKAMPTPSFVGFTPSVDGRGIHPDQLPGSIGNTNANNNNLHHHHQQHHHHQHIPGSDLVQHQQLSYEPITPLSPSFSLGHNPFGFTLSGGAGEGSRTITNNNVPPSSTSSSTPTSRRGDDSSSRSIPQQQQQQQHHHHPIANPSHHYTQPSPSSSISENHFRISSAPTTFVSLCASRPYHILTSFPSEANTLAEAVEAQSQEELQRLIESPILPKKTKNFARFMAKFINLCRGGHVHGGQPVAVADKTFCCPAERELAEFVEMVLSTTDVSLGISIQSLYYIYRICAERLTSYSVEFAHEGTTANLDFIVGTLLANKVLDDHSLIYSFSTFTNRTWSDLSRIDIETINKTEAMFLEKFNYAVVMKREEFRSWITDIHQAYRTIQENKIPSLFTSPNVRRRYVKQPLLQCLNSPAPSFNPFTITGYSDHLHYANSPLSCSSENLAARNVVQSYQYYQTSLISAHAAAAADYSNGVVRDQSQFHQQQQQHSIQHQLQQQQLHQQQLQQQQLQLQQQQKHLQLQQQQQQQQIHLQSQNQHHQYHPQFQNSSPHQVSNSMLQQPAREVYRRHSFDVALLDQLNGSSGERPLHHSSSISQGVEALYSSHNLHASPSSMSTLSSSSATVDAASAVMDWSKQFSSRSGTLSQQHLAPPLPSTLQYLQMQPSSTVSSAYRGSGGMASGIAYPGQAHTQQPYYQHHYTHQHQILPVMRSHDDLRSAYAASKSVLEKDCFGMPASQIHGSLSHGLSSSTLLSQDGEKSLPPLSSFQALKPPMYPGQKAVMDHFAALHHASDGGSNLGHDDDPSRSFLGMESMLARSAAMAHAHGGGGNRFGSSAERSRFNLGHLGSGTPHRVVGGAALYESAASFSLHSGQQQHQQGVDAASLMHFGNAVVGLQQQQQQQQQQIRHGGNGLQYASSGHSTPTSFQQSGHYPIAIPSNL
ncbi:hypothetical protein HDU97_009919 [Phlyctochytrium planicorne]|nr:hypothetical protein HDU97_009919 [Phlyctochytrium planicorne]